MKCIWYNGFPEIYSQLEEGVGSIFNEYMCIVLYIYETYLVYWFSRDLCLIGGGGWGQSAMGICALCYICQVWCNGIQGIYA